MNAFSRSYALFKESFSVLKKDKEIMLFPVLSGAAGLLVLLSFVLSMFFLNLFGDFGSVMSYVAIFLFYLVSYFITIFFNVGLISCASIRMNGGDPTFGDGMRSALKHLDKILIWALISATVGMILRRLSEKSGLLGRIVIGLIGMAWSLLTYFVVPVMIFEQVSVVDSVKKSGQLFRKTWGENVIGQFSMGFFFSVLYIIGLIPLVLGAILLSSGSFMPLLVLGVLVFAYWIGLAVLSASLAGIYMTALYIYATKGVVPSGFSEDSIRNAWKPKSQR